MITTSPLVFGTFWIFIAAGWLEAAYDFGFLLRPLRDKAGRNILFVFGVEILNSSVFIEASKRRQVR